MEQVLLSTCEVLNVAVSHFLRSEPENKILTWSKDVCASDQRGRVTISYSIYCTIFSTRHAEDHVKFSTLSPISMFYLPLLLLQKIKFLYFNTLMPLIQFFCTFLEAFHPQLFLSGAQCINCEPNLKGHLHQTQPRLVFFPTGKVTSLK